MSLKKKVKKSLFWTFSDQVVVQFANLFFGLFIARLLGPESFGIIGVVLMFTNFAQLFVDMGFGAAIVQNQQLTSRQYASVFWLNCVIASFIYLLLYFLSDFVALFFNQPILSSVIKVSSLSIILNATSIVQFNVLIKSLNFKKKVIINWVSLFFGYATAIVMALNNYGVWAIVAMYLVNSIVQMFMVWVGSKWYPTLHFEMAVIRSIWQFGLPAFGDNVLNYWSRNFDNFIIGKCLGTSQLGIYSRAYSLMLLPVKNLSSVVSKVFFPAFSQRQEDVTLLADNYLKLIKYIAVLTFPLLIGLSLVSNEFVLLFLGEQWKAMIPVLSLLSIVGALQSIVTLNGVIYYSLGKTKIAFRISLLVNVVLIVSFFVGVQFGIKGVAWSYLLANILLFYPVYTTAIGLLNLKISRIFTTLKSVIAATLAMVFGVCVLGLFLEVKLFYAFILKVSIGLFIYMWVFYQLETQFVQIILGQIRKQIKRVRNENH